MHLATLIAATALVTASAASAAPTTIDFSDQPGGFATVASPLVYPGATFSSTNGLRIFTFGGLPIDRALCPHATRACESALTVTFAGPVSNLSFDVIQVDEIGKFLNVVATTSGGTVMRSIALTRALIGNRIELSAISGITAVTIDGTSDIEGVLYDNFRFDDGAAVPGAVPEPNLWLMMIAGFAFAGVGLRRRKASPTRAADA